MAAALFYWITSKVYCRIDDTVLEDDTVRISDISPIVEQLLPTKCSCPPKPMMVDSGTNPEYGRRQRRKLSSESNSSVTLSDTSCNWGSVPDFECNNETHQNSRLAECDYTPFVFSYYISDDYRLVYRKPKRKQIEIDEFSSSEEEYQERKANSDLNKTSLNACNSIINYLENHEQQVVSISAFKDMVIKWDNRCIGYIKDYVLPDFTLTFSIQELYDKRSSDDCNRPCGKLTPPTIQLMNFLIGDVCTWIWVMAYTASTTGTVTVIDMKKALNAFFKRRYTLTNKVKEKDTVFQHEEVLKIHTNIVNANDVVKAITIETTEQCAIQLLIYKLEDLAWYIMNYASENAELNRIGKSEIEIEPFDIGYVLENKKYNWKPFQKLILDRFPKYLPI